MTSLSVSDRLFGVEKEFGTVQNGRYWMPDLDNPGEPFPRGYMRTTNLIGAYTETRALNIWEQNRMLEGLIDRPDLYAELVTLPRDEDGFIPYASARDITARALAAARADRWAVQGSAQHRVLEHRVTTGELIGTPEMREYQLALEALLKAHLLKPEPSLTERIVVNNTLKCAGRFDVPLWNLQSGALLMGDLKTKRKNFFTMLELRAQLAVYARADAMWDPTRACYVDMPPFDPDWGIIMHVPQEGGQMSILDVDLEKGWQTALRAREVVDDRAEAKSAGTLRDAFRPAPVMDGVEKWAARLSMVDTLGEGEQVMQEIREALGVMPAELAALAGEVAEEILRKQLTS